MEWMESLSDDWKESEMLKQYDSLDSAFNGFKEARAAVSNSIRMAGPDASAESKAEIYQKIMKHMPELVLKPNPDSAEQTAEFHAMMGVPEEYSWDGEGLDEATVTELNKLSTGVKHTKQQHKKYMEMMSEMQGLTTQQRDDSRIRMGAELKTEWGMAFEDRYAVVEKHLQENPGLGSIEHMSPEQIKAHYETSRALNGVKQMHSQPAPGAIMTPAEALAQIKEIDNNPIFYSMEPADRQKQTELRIRRIELMRLSDPAKYM